MNTKNYFKKKDIIVMFVNLLVLTIVIYIYYIVENVKTILSSGSSLCALKSTSDVHLTKGSLEEVYFDSSEMKGHKVQIRQIRSTDSIKCNLIFIFIFFNMITYFLIITILFSCFQFKNHPCSSWHNRIKILNKMVVCTLTFSIICQLIIYYVYTIAKTNLTILMC